jgi:hypothetical protein
MAFGGLRGTFESAATSPGTGFAATGSIAVSVGDIVVVALGSRNLGGDPVTFTDNFGNNYTEETASDVSGRCIYPAWVRITTAGTLTSVSFSQTSDNGDKAMVVGVFEGPFDDVDPLDIVLAGNTTDSAEPWLCPATGTLAQADELIIGMITHGNGIVEGQYTATAPFSMVEQESSNGTASNSCSVGMCYQVVSATTTQTPTFEQSTASSAQGTSRYTLSFKKGTNTQALTPSLYTNSPTFHTPTVTPGAVGLTPSLYDDGDTFYSHTALSTYALTPELFSDSASPYIDVSGNGHDATVGSGAPTLAAGDTGQGQALLLDGNDYLSVADHTDLDITGAITVVARAKVNTFNTSWQAIVCKGDSAWRLHRHSSDNTVAFGTAGLSNIDLQSATSINDGQWHHIAGVYDGSANKYVYLDGVEDATIGATGSISANNFALGIGDNTENLTRGWIGLIDDVRVYNRALSPSEIADLYAGVHITSGLVAYYPFDSGDAFYSPTITVGAVNLSPSLFDDGTDTFYTHLLETSGGIQDLTPDLYADADTFYSHTAASTYALTPSLFVDDDTFFTHAISVGAVNLAPSLYADDDTFYSHTVTPGAVTLTPSLYSDDDTFFSATAASTYALVPSLYSDDDTFHTAALSGVYPLAAALFSDDDTFYTHAISTAGSAYAVVSFISAYGAAGDSTNLFPSLFSDGDTFYSATLSATYALTPSLYSDADAFHSATLSNLNTLVPSLYADDDTFYSATITVGAVDLAPSLYADDDTFYSATITVGAVNLAPALFSDDDTFYGATASNLNTLVPSLYADDDTFFSASLAASSTLVPSLYEDDDTFYSATISQQQLLSPALFSDGDTFYSHTISSGAVELVAALYEDADTFYSATLSATYALTPSLYVDDDTFYSAAIVTVQALAPSLYEDDDTFYSPTLTYYQPLEPELFADDDTFFAHRIFNVVADRIVYVLAEDRIVYTLATDTSIAPLNSDRIVYVLPEERIVVAPQIDTDLNPAEQAREVAMTIEDRVVVAA